MHPITPSYTPVAESALLLSLGDTIDESVNRQLMHLWQKTLQANIKGILEITPAFTTMLILFDPILTDCQTITKRIQKLCRSLQDVESIGKTVDIPVCYGGRYGEDLSYVCMHTGLSQQEVISLHSKPSYLIYMIGFLPAFPYLGGMDERLFTPRLQNPRVRIPAGSVGIGGEQTGIYPVESPGGWQLIGRTPLMLFDPQTPEKSLYQAGDRIRFVPIDAAEYQRLSQENVEVQT